MIFKTIMYLKRTYVETITNMQSYNVNIII